MTGKTEPSQALQTFRSNDLEALDMLFEIIATDNHDIQMADNPEEISRQILEELWAAEDVESLERKEAEGWEQYVGVPFQLLSWTTRKSEYREGSPVYFIVRVIDMRDGESRILTTGSRNVQVQIMKLTKLGELPGAIRILAADETEGKNTVMRLVMAPNEAEARKAARVAARQGADE